MNATATIVSKVWSFCTTLRDDGVGYGDTLTASLQQAEALRQSILKKAFAGTLVAQDANDEPAAALLARIKAERTTVANTATVAARPGKTAKGK